MGKKKFKKSTLLRNKDKKTQPLLSDPAQDPNFRPMFAPCGDVLATTSLVSSQRPETPTVKSAAISNLIRGLRKLPTIAQGKLEESLPEPEILRRDEGEHEETHMEILADIQILTEPESTGKPHLSFHNSTPVKTNPSFPNLECSAIERPETPEDTVACFEERNPHCLETASGDSSFSSFADSSVNLPEQFPDPPDFAKPYLNPTSPSSSARQSKEGFPPFSGIFTDSIESQSSIRGKKPTIKEKQRQVTSRNFDLKKVNTNDAETEQTSANQTSFLSHQKSKEQIPPNPGVLTTDPSEFQPPSLEEKQTKNNAQPQTTSRAFDLEISLNAIYKKRNEPSPEAAKESSSKLDSSYKGTRFNPFKKAGGSKSKQMPKRTATNVSTSEIGPGRWRGKSAMRSKDFKQYQLEMERSPDLEPFTTFVKSPKYSYAWTFAEGIRYNEAVEEANTVIITRPPNFNFNAPVKPFVKKFKLREDTP